MYVKKKCHSALPAQYAVYTIKSSHFLNVCFSLLHIKLQSTSKHHSLTGLSINPDI